MVRLDRGQPICLSVFLVRVNKPTAQHSKRGWWKKNSCAVVSPQRDARASVAHGPFSALVRINVIPKCTHESHRRATCAKSDFNSANMAETGTDPPPVADEESGVMGLTEVDPSPVEETPAEFKEGYFPASSPSPSTRTSTLGLGNHGPAYYRTFSRHP